MPGRILTAFLLTLFLFSLIPAASACFANNYSNKDIDTMKKQQKPVTTNLPDTSGDSGKVYKNSDVKSLKSEDTGKSYTRKGDEKTPKQPGKVKYQSPDGAIKIEVTSKNTISNKDIIQMKQQDKGKNYDRNPAAGQNAVELEKLPVTITELPIREKMLPYKEWEEEYKDYFFKHYDNESLTLTPRVMVIRSTSAHSTEEVLDLFKRGSLYPDGDDGLIFGHLSCHFIIDASGGIIQALPLNVVSRGAYGVNNVAITIELVGVGNEELINNDAQKKALYSLVAVLMRKCTIPLNKVYGHHEVCEGKSVVPEYTEFSDSDYPTCYSPEKLCYDPGPRYMQQLRSFFTSKTSRGKQ